MGRLLFLRSWFNDLSLPFTFWFRPFCQDRRRGDLKDYTFGSGRSRAFSDKRDLDFDILKFGWQLGWQFGWQFGWQLG